jgi:hypothetical protein
MHDGAAERPFDLFMPLMLPCSKLPTTQSGGLSTTTATTGSRPRNFRISCSIEELAKIA